MQKMCECSNGREFFHGVPHATLRDDYRDGWEKEILRLTFSPEMTPAEENEFLLAAYRAVHRFIPPEVRAGLYKLTDSRENGAFVISNVPCVVPPDKGENTGKTQYEGLVTPAVLFGLVAQAGGIPFGYWEEQYGKLLHDIRKLAGRELTKSSQGTVKLPFHGDGACFRDCHRPTFLILAGIENENGVATCLLHVEKDILRNIPTGLLKEVETAQFTFGIPESFLINNVIAGVKNRAIIYYDKDGCPRIALPSSGFPQETKKAARVLREFHQYLATLPSRKIPLKAGRVLAFDNTRHVHGRDSIEGKRWLQRLYFRTSLEEMRQATKSNAQSNRFRAVDLLLSGN